ncbi:MAG: ATP-binding protein [Sandaracinaceae bacterium]
MSSDEAESELRRRARERLMRKQASRLRDVSPEQVVEELRIHQIELELQNEELRRAESDLSDSFDAYLELFDFSPVAFITLDVGFRIEKLNRAAREQLAPVAVGSSMLTLVPREAKGSLASWLREIGTVEGQSELELMRANCTTGVFLVQGVRLAQDQRLLGLRDVTTVREAQERLLTSERDMRRLVDHSPDAVCVSHDGMLMYVNHRFEQVIGGMRSRLQAARLSSFVHADDVALLESLTQEAEEAPDAVSIRMLTLDGGERMVEVRAMPIHFGGRASVLYTARDLTERRRIEARMEQAERLATVGMLVAGVAHEVNNPLAFTMGNLEVLVEALKEREDADLLGAAEDALIGVRRVATIVSDLRTFQRVDDEIRGVEPNRVVVQTLRLAEPEVPSHVRVSRDLGSVPTVLGNESRLGQVLLNLIMNAAQAMHAPTEDAAPPEGAPANWVRVRTWLADRDVCIAVEDNGPGIAKDQLAHIFDPFFTTRRAAGGTGLGLAICNSLVQQMGGFISVDSELGGGTRFVVHLPTSEAAEHPPEVTPSQAPRLGPGLTVLVVDDEEGIVRSVRRLLRGQATLVEARSGREATKLLEGRTDIDAVLCDLVMSDGGGHDVLAWLETHQPELVSRLIFMTGMAHPDLPLRSAANVLHKPFTRESLRQMLASVLDPATKKDP